MKTIIALLIWLFAAGNAPKDYVSYSAAPSEIKFFHLDDHGNPYGTIEQLRDELSESDQLLTFACNGARYMPDYSPCGMYIENGKTVRKYNSRIDNGMVLSVSCDNKASLVPQEKFVNNAGIKLAMQSYPALVQDGAINSRLSKKSNSVFVRNGVGVLPSGRLVFIVTTKEVNLYDFADMFKREGCISAMYLDGAVSEMYLPSKGLTASSGYFGMIIAVTHPK